MIQLLINLGFSESEAKLYLALLKIGRGTIAECVKLAGISRSSAYAIMRKLVDVGLVAEESGKPSHFHCLPPRQAIDSYIHVQLQEFDSLYKIKMAEIEREREENIKNLNKNLPSIVEKLVEQAEELYDQNPIQIDTDRELMILRGQKIVYEVIKPIWPQKSIKSMTRAPVLFKLNDVYWEEHRELANQGVVEYTLCESIMLEDPEYLRTVKAFLEFGDIIKHLPSLPSKMEIYDDSICLVMMRYNQNPKEMLSLFVKNRDLVATFVHAFNGLWEIAKPVNLREVKNKLKKNKNNKT